MSKRKTRPTSQNEINVTLKLLKMQLRRHHENLRIPAIQECKRQLAELHEEEEAKAIQKLTGIAVE